MNKVIEFHLQPTHEEAFRFGVADADGRRSGTYKIWTSKAANSEKADIYIVGRNMDGAMKVSIHASGMRQVGLTQEFVQCQPAGEIEKRHFDRWEQPVWIGDEVALEYLFRFPTDHLRSVSEPSKKVVWMPAAPRGRCVEVGLLVSDSADSLNLDFKGAIPVAVCKLADGRFLMLACKHVDYLEAEGAPEIYDSLSRLMTLDGYRPEPSHRLLVGFKSNEMRGWIDCSVDQFLNEFGCVTD